jgi:multidrug transporter EmrE-like cation transporter
MVTGLGLGLAALAALATNVGFLLRHRGANEAPDVDMRRPLRSAVDLFRSKWWSVGYALAALAYLLHMAALGLIALSVVQAVLAGGIVLMAVIAERFFGFGLQKRQWIGVVLAAAGLAGLALTSDIRSGDETANYSVAAMIAFEAALVGVGVGLILCCRLERARPLAALLLALAAGLLFTLTHVAFKAASGAVDRGLDAVLLSPYPWLALAGGVVAFFASARSLQLGDAVPVIAVTAIAGNASSIPAGVVVFGDPIGSDALTIGFRVLAFLLVIAAATLIPAPGRAARPAREPEGGRLSGRVRTA